MPGRQKVLRSDNLWRKRSGLQSSTYAQRCFDYWTSRDGLIPTTSNPTYSAEKLIPLKSP